jgi:protein SCO1/2
MRRTSALLFTFLLLLTAPALANAEDANEEPAHPSDHSAAAPVHESHDHEAMQQQSERDEGVGVDERLGEKISLDTVFVDEEGRELEIREAITKPTLLLPIFFSCTVTCPIMLANLANAINDVPLEFGREYGVIAFSFDEEDSSDVARASKVNYAKILEEGLPAAEWRFLTGDLESIVALTHSLGFNFKRIGKHLFIHPNVLIALAPDGTIIRYLYGPRFLPFDVGMALTEAEKGTPGLSIRKVLTYCFDYDPESKSYVVRSFRLLALGIVALLGILFFFIVRKR